MKKMISKLMNEDKQMKEADGFKKLLNSGGLSNVYFTLDNKDIQLCYNNKVISTQFNKSDLQNSILHINRNISDNSSFDNNVRNYYEYILTHQDESDIDIVRMNTHELMFNTQIEILKDAIVKPSVIKPIIKYVLTFFRFSSIANKKPDDILIEKYLSDGDTIIVSVLSVLYKLMYIGFAVKPIYKMGRMSLAFLTTFSQAICDSILELIHDGEITPHPSLYLEHHASVFMDSDILLNFMSYKISDTVNKNNRNLLDKFSILGMEHNSIIEDALENTVSALFKYSPVYQPEGEMLQDVVEDKTSRVPKSEFDYSNFMKYKIFGNNKAPKHGNHNINEFIFLTKNLASYMSTVIRSTVGHKFTVKVKILVNNISDETETIDNNSFYKEEVILKHKDAKIYNMNLRLLKLLNVRLNKYMVSNNLVDLYGKYKIKDTDNNSISIDKQTLHKSILWKYVVNNGGDIYTYHLLTHRLKLKILICLSDRFMKFGYTNIAHALLSEKVNEMGRNSKKLMNDAENVVLPMIRTVRDDMSLKRVIMILSSYYVHNGITYDIVDEFIDIISNHKDIYDDVVF